MPIVEDTCSFNNVSNSSSLSTLIQNSNASSYATSNSSINKTIGILSDISTSSNLSYTNISQTQLFWVDSASSQTQSRSSIYPALLVVRSTLNGFLRGPVLTPSSNSVGGFVKGLPSGTSDIHDSLDLFMDVFNDVEDNITLFVDGDPVAQPYTDDITLFMQGLTNTSSNSIPLVLYNEIGDVLSYYSLTTEQYFNLTTEEYYNLVLTQSTAFSSGINLSITGGGATANWVPDNEGMNLYLQGVPFADKRLKMYINGFGPTSGTLPLYTFGVTGIMSSGINMYMAGINTDSDTLDMFVRGYTW